MKTAQADIRFPTLGFTPDGEAWGFPDFARLTTCGPDTLKKNLQDGMELVDAEQRRWVVRSVTRLGRTGSRLLVLLTAKPQSVIEHELEELPPLSLDEVKARLTTTIEAFPSDWGASQDDPGDMPRALAAVAGARSVAELYEAVGADLDTFEGY